MMLASGDAPAVSDEAVAFLRASGCFDEYFYRNRSGLSVEIDAAVHHLTVGSQQGFDPNPHFEGSFLRPFYEAAGFFEAPILTWLELTAMGGPTPSSWAEAEALAQAVRGSALFDALNYARRLPTGMDSALHYVVVGERIGWRPSAGFDPSYYLERNPDLVNLPISALHHFEVGGQHEQRRPLSVADGISFAPLVEDDRPVVLIISHEASRTGAPLLGWNIMRRLADRCRIVSLMMRGGELEADFAILAAVTVGPLTWDDWQPLEMRRIAQRLVATYKPLYAIANSIETCLMVPPLAALGVPTVALVHEFAAYTRPLQKMRNVYDWAAHVVFPAQIVADSSMRAFPDLKARVGLHLMAQGCSDLPTRGEPVGAAKPDQGSGCVLRPAGFEDAFVILGAGSVHLRKGVDLFIGAAATARRLRPDIRFRFVWIGHGYDPVNDISYSTYIAEQILHSNLGSGFVMMDAVEDLEPIYAQADVFFMCSRLDPQPNVGIDAIVRGIPTVCFKDACGTAEILAAHPDTSHLVVPHLDVHAAATKICDLASGRHDLGAIRAAVAAVGRDAYDMQAYVARIDALGHEAAAALNQEDLDLLVAFNAVDPSLLMKPSSELPMPVELERIALLKWSLWSDRGNSSVERPVLRRACAGFHPQRYAQDHHDDCIAGHRDPLAHWLQNGRPAGPWSREVFTPPDAAKLGQAVAPRIALHAHFHYTNLAADLAARLCRNRSQVDLFLSTNEESKAKELRHDFRHHQGQVTVGVSPNQGRDIGPFLTGLAEEIASNRYDLFGHIHAKRSLAVDARMGDSWREFLWENLIGGMHPMLDLAAAVFAARPSLGLLMAEDPHLVGWGENLPLATDLAQRMGFQTPLDTFFDFPLGTMFWARPEALLPLLTLGLSWDSYPAEPVPYDGTILHALERLVPFAVRHAGFDVAGLRVPSTTW
jgi:glycosyltransferase involved in cell wall biosynthesis